MKNRFSTRLIGSTKLGGVARIARPGLVRLRYFWQRYQAGAGYDQYGRDYSQRLLFVAGLPKSGTSWLESMLASYPGFASVMIPEAVAYEAKHKGSHRFELPDNIFERLDEHLAVIKLHVHGSTHNRRLLRNSGFNWVVLYRDPRDVAVSHYHYVRRTPWHPEYYDYRKLDIKEGLAYFGHTLLGPFRDWVRSWRRERGNSACLQLKYEELLDNTAFSMTKVADHFGLPKGKQLAEIVDRNSFENVAGRERGVESKMSFARKGIAGDWVNHFSPDVERLFKEKIGDLLIELGYERDNDWRAP